MDADRRLRDRLLVRFLAAAEDGDVAALEALLAQDAVFYSDGGGKAVAARKQLFGARRIARVMATILRTAEGIVSSVLTIDVLEGRMQTVRIIRNPDKLAHLSSPVAR